MYLIILFMNKKGWLIIGLVILVAFGVYNQISSSPSKINCVTIDGKGCGCIDDGGCDGAGMFCCWDGTCASRFDLDCPCPPDAPTECIETGGGTFNKICCKTPTCGSSISGPRSLGWVPSCGPPTDSEQCSGDEVFCEGETGGSNACCPPFFGCEIDSSNGNALCDSYGQCPDGLEQCGSDCCQSNEHCSSQWLGGECIIDECPEGTTDCVGFGGNLICCEGGEYCTGKNFGHTPQCLPVP